MWEVGSENLVVTDYIASHPDQFTEFGKLIENAGLGNLLSTRGPYTLFLPTDDAMKQYYAEQGVTSFEELINKTSGKRLIFNHLVLNEIGSGDILLGALRDTNAIGDFLVTEFQGSDIIVNKHSKIIDRDVRAANGYIHIIDQVIEPVTKSVYDILSEDASYALFAKGLELTGLKDTLQIITFPYGKKQARTRFTILAVPDTVFNKYGINTIEQLISTYTSNADSIMFLENGFYRYMEYHCLNNTYYLSDFESKLYPILSYDNNIIFTFDTEDYKINLDRTTKEYTGFNIDQSNVPAKNGSIHTINDLLPVMIPPPTPITFEVTDYFDLKQGDYFGKYYKKWSDGQNTFADIKWEGDFLQYYFKDHDTGELLNDDCLQMLGFWWLEVKTPKIMKGKYTLSGNIWANNVDYEVYVDGVKTALVNYSDPAKTTSFGEFNWTTTERHTVKVVSISWGSLFWDTLIFTPTN